MSCWLCLLFTLQQTTLIPLLQAGLGHRPLLLGQLQEPPEGALLPAPQPSYSFTSLRAEAAVLPAAGLLPAATFPVPHPLCSLMTLPL